MSESMSTLMPKPTPRSHVLSSSRASLVAPRWRLALPLVLLLLGGLFLLPGCLPGDSGSAVEASNVWARPESKGANSAAYMTLRNTSDDEIKLIGAASDVAGKVEIHKTSAGEGGMMKMEKIDGVVIPAGGSVELKPGGYHVMFMGLQRDLAVGDEFTLTLTFDKGDELTLEVEVKQANTSTMGAQMPAHR